MFRRLITVALALIIIISCVPVSYATTKTEGFVSDTIIEAEAG